MSETLINQLKKLKDIEPGHEFKKRSLTRILNTSQNYKAPIFHNFFAAFQFSGALIMASVLIFIILGGLSVLNLKIFSPAMLASLNTEHLNEELEGLDLKIRLSEVSYYEDAPSAVSVALGDSSQNKSDRLNSAAIEKEAQNLNDIEAESATLEELLNKLSL